MILLIDSYDSFTNNLAHLLQTNSGQQVATIHNDAFSPSEYENFYSEYLPLFEYIVIGPGPGHPSIEKDVGIIRWLLQRMKRESGLGKNVVPVLGICLGFQSLCLEFGNAVNRLKNVRHGQIYDIHPVEDQCGGLFKQADKFESVRYHSLFVGEVNNEIIPLAYCFEQEQQEKILMAVRHVSLPFYGVQYHPESICSKKGDDLVKNFTEIAAEYNREFRPQVFGNHIDLSRNWLNHHAVHEDYLIEGGNLKTNKLESIYFKQIKLDVNAMDVCDYFHKRDSENNFVLLNSASIPGEWSIIGLPIEGQSEIITHSVDDNKVHLSTYKSDKSTTTDGPVWKVLARRMQEKYISRDTFNGKLGEVSGRALPFFGGYMGLISYEEGQHVIIEKLESICGDKATPDLKLIYIERFLAYNHIRHDWYIVSINKQDDTNWGDSLIEELNTITQINIDDIPMSVKYLAEDSDQDLIKFKFPDQEVYAQQFAKCQEWLHSGDSYELCLTTQSKIYLPNYIDPWDIYKVLTLRKNPSPFSCFMQFDDCTLLSSSPERFLSWKDEHENSQTKIAELRPIKGTVKNTDDITFEKASAILKTPKEMGENLMIVDLIRHDLYQFLSSVQVTQLMAVEEYKTVFQLVSVIRGSLDREGYHGIDLLHSSLPPGSMTGAPKRRSVELLQDIESMQEGIIGGRRGIYSGVVGYWSVTDDADWSVIIRSVFHYNGDIENGENTKCWRIGAGGAITVLSDAQGEWEEMDVKLRSALSAFA
ncbi:Aminodeoxychorismate synthase [Spathaspora sp. JA1]|nr:Aminodeoxychorismate synthase [Spathaspora sp. JA1]